jgi:hypothetical protein
VNATVAERGGRARAIRNQGPRQTQRRRSQANPRTPRQQLPGPRAAAAPRASAMTQRATASRPPRETPAGTALRAGAGPQGSARHQRPAHLRLVADHGRLVHPVFESGAGRPGGGLVLAGGNGEPARRDRDQGRVSQAPARRTRPGGARPDRTGAHDRLRLTRRGRLVITSTLVLLIAVVSMVLASTADAVVHL